MKTFKTILAVATMVAFLMIGMSGCATVPTDNTNFASTKTCNSNLEDLARGMTKDQVKAIYGNALESGTTNDGYFYWIILTDTGTTRSQTERRLEYNSILQLFWDKDDSLLGYREQCRGTWSKTAVLKYGPVVKEEKWVPTVSDNKCDYCYDGSSTENAKACLDICKENNGVNNNTAKMPLKSK